MHRTLKYIAFTLCFTLLVGCKKSETTSAKLDDTATDTTPVEEEITTEESVDSKNPSNTSTEEKETQNKPDIPLPTIDKSSWNLILVNSKNPISEDRALNTALTINSKEVDERILEPLQEMIASAKEDGLELFVDSAYRSVEYQREIMDKNIKRHLEKGYSEEAARLMAQDYVSIPGHSEHHTGLAVDIITPSYQVLDTGYAKTEAAIWLKEHAADFGFILRYPKDKTDITGISYEPWHYRYVGKEHSRYIMNNNLCLEEYLQMSE